MNSHLGTRLFRTSKVSHTSCRQYTAPSSIRAVDVTSQAWFWYHQRYMIRYLDIMTVEESWACSALNILFGIQTAGHHFFQFHTTEGAMQQAY